MIRQTTLTLTYQRSVEAIAFLKALAGWGLMFLLTIALQVFTVDGVHPLLNKTVGVAVSSYILSSIGR